MQFDPQEAERLAAEYEDVCQDKHGHAGGCRHSRAANTLRAAVTRVRDLEIQIVAATETRKAVGRRLAAAEKVVEAAREYYLTAAVKRTMDFEANHLERAIQEYDNA